MAQQGFRVTDHLAPGKAWVGVEPVEIDRHRVRRKRLDLEFTQGFAVHGVGAVGAEGVHVKTSIDSCESSS